MASITVRQLDPAVKERLRVRAARHGRSMEAEVRCILTEAVQEGPVRENLVDIALGLFGPEHGVELEAPARDPIREPPGLGPGA